MTHTTLSESPARLARTTAGAACLVGGAVALALARALSNNGGSPADRLHQVTGHQAQMTVSVLLAVAGFAALIPGFLAVAGQVRRKGTLLATIGSALCLVGFVGFAVLAAMDIPTIAATHVSAPSAMAELLHQIDDAAALAVLGPCAVAGFFVGPFLVTLAARRAQLVPGWLPFGVLVSLILQPVGVMLVGPSLGLRLLDTACQLVFVAMAAFLARHALSTPGR